MRKGEILFRRRFIISVLKQPAKNQQTWPKFLAAGTQEEGMCLGFLENKRAPIGSADAAGWRSSISHRKWESPLAFLWLPHLHSSLGTGPEKENTPEFISL